MSHCTRDNRLMLRLTAKQLWFIINQLEHSFEQGQLNPAEERTMKALYKAREKVLPSTPTLEIGYFEHSRTVEGDFCPVTTNFIWSLSQSERHRIPQRFKVFIQDAEQCKGSVEPSAPVEIDERAEFENWADRNWPGAQRKQLERDGYDAYKNPCYRDFWTGWQARAALARKS